MHVEEEALYPVIQSHQQTRLLGVEEMENLRQQSTMLVSAL